VYNTSSPFNPFAGIFGSASSTDSLQDNFFVNLLGSAFGAIGNSIKGVVLLGVQSLWSTAGNHEPYSYVTRVTEGIYTGLNTPSSDFASSTINIDSENFVFSSTIFDASSLTTVISQDGWDAMRPWFELAFYILFFFYLFHLVFYRLI